MSLQNALNLHQALIKSNKYPQIKPLIQELSQLFIYGDHQNQELFEYLAENNIIALFHSKLAITTTELHFLIISKISFIISNLKNTLNINYVLSNPILNDFINHSYDFNNQEMVDYYLNFLKIIAIRINRENIFLYYNQRYPSFPLLWQAQKFINYPDSLVRSAVKVIILSVSKLFNQSNDLTQSILQLQNLGMKKFEIYLLKSPFIISYLQQIHYIQQILPNITQSSFDDQFEDFFMFFNDLLKQCPFLNRLFEQIIIHQLVLPILNYLLLNQKSEIQPEFCVGFYLIYQIIIKFPFKKILNYFSEDMIIKETFDLPKYYHKQPGGWVYETQNYLEEFEQIYLEDQIDEKQINALQNQQPNDHIQNIYKIQMFLLLTPRKNNILTLQLAIWQIIQNNKQERPIAQIIQLLKHQDAVFYSKKLIDQIIFFLINEDIKSDILLNIYQEYDQKVKDLINNYKEQKTSLEAIEANWELIQNFDWKTFKKSQPTLTLEDLQNLDIENELREFKTIYLWLLLKCLVMKFDKQSSNNQYIVNQEISYFNDNSYFLIDENRKYLIINPNLRYIILATPCQNPHKGKVSFAYSLLSLSCSKEDDYLKFECNKLTINRIQPFKVLIPNQSKDEIFQKIQGLKRETLSSVEQLVKQFN